MSRPPLSRSPRLGRLLLYGLLPSELASALEGDLEEGFRRRTGRQAHLWFWWQVLTVPYWRLTWRYRRIERARRQRIGRRENRNGPTGARPSGGAWTLDLRVALRSLLTRPAFAVTAILTLTLSLGGATLLFSVTEGVLLRPLPYEASDRIVSIYLLNHAWRTSDNELLRSHWDDAAVLADHAEAFHDHVPELEGAASSITYGSTSLIWGELEDSVSSVGVDAHVFDVLGVPPTLGRVPSSAEHAAGSPVAVLRHDVWKRTFGGVPEVLGEPFELDGTVYTVIGVMPPGFYFPDERSGDLWRPIPPDHADYLRAGIGRLAEGASVSEASAAVDRVARRLGEENPEYADLGARVAPALEEIVSGVRVGILLLFGAGLVVLLVACLNLANLVLVRGAARRGELAVRAAIGASRGALVRAVFAEVLIVCLLGGVLGLGAATLAIDPFVHALTSSLGSLPRTGGIDLNPNVLAFALAATMATAILAGLPVALAAARQDPAGALSAGGRGAADGPSTTRRGLLAAQVGLAALLLTGAGLLTRSVLESGSIDPGFEARSLAWLRVSVASDDLPVAEMGQLRNALTRIEGVSAVAFSRTRPIGGAMFFNELGDPGDEGSLGTIPFTQVDPSYFRALGIPLLRGRILDRPPAEDEPMPAIVNERLARVLQTEGAVIGRRMTFGSAQSAVPIEIAGVVADTRHFLLQEPQGQLYLVDHAFGLRNQYVILRATGDPSDLPGRARSVLASALPQAEISSQGTTKADISGATLQLRTRAWLILTLAGLAAVLAIVGIAGIAAHFLAAQRREVAVRMALGAAPRREVRRVLGHAMAPVFLGLVGGLAGTAVLARFAERLWLADRWAGLLYQTSATDPWVYGSVATLLFVAAALAAWLPSRRATAVNPAEVLNGEG